MRRSYPVRANKAMNVWEHPTKQEIRVYLNGMPYQPTGVKLWVAQGNHNNDWCVRLYTDWTDDRRRIIDAATNKVQELVGHGCTFDQIVEYARKL